MRGESQKPGGPVPLSSERSNTGTDYPRDQPIHALFEEQARRAPEATALMFADGEMSYGELDDRANRLSDRLAQVGIGRGTLVGLCIERSPELIVGLLAILKAGGAYVPLDPDYPDERLSWMLRDTASPAILTHPPTEGRLARLPHRAREISVESGSRPAAVRARPAGEATAADLAYVIYTSGSTGTPKGVMIGHRAVVRLVRNTNYCDFGPDQVFLLLAPISFDASTFEIWGPLLNGARLAIMDPGSPTLDALGRAIRRYGVTTLWLTAGLFHLMVEQRIDDLAPLRQLLAGGDVLSPPHVQAALEALRDGVVINGYGPTESTTFACCFRMGREYRAGDTIPIGQPISNTTVHLLDERGDPVPAGAPGELFIGGDGLGRGYLNHPELTRQKFIPDPFSSEPGARLYRTGDRARRRPDGIIVFLGRLDDQVKILGHRVEPGEIEATLRSHPQIRQAVVSTPADDRGEKRLAAYFVGAAPGRPEIAELKDYLADRLPAYMIPATFTELDEFPLSPNGKVDRSALPAPGRPNRHRSVADSCSTSLPATIARIWAEVLDCPVGPDDNFFDLGGDSLHLIEVHSELQKSLSTEVSILDLFEYPTVRSLADRLDRIAVPEPAPEPEPACAGDRARQQREAFARRKPSRATTS